MRNINVFDNRSEFDLIASGEKMPSTITISGAKVFKVNENDGTYTESGTTSEWDGTYVFDGEVVSGFTVYSWVCGNKVLYTYPGLYPAPYDEEVDTDSMEWWSMVAITDPEDFNCDVISIDSVGYEETKEYIEPWVSYSRHGLLSSFVYEQDWDIYTTEPDRAAPVPSIVTTEYSGTEKISGKTVYMWTEVSSTREANWVYTYDRNPVIGDIVMKPGLRYTGHIIGLGEYGTDGGKVDYNQKDNWIKIKCGQAISRNYYEKILSHGKDFDNSSASTFYTYTAGNNKVIKEKGPITFFNWREYNNYDHQEREYSDVLTKFGDGKWVLQMNLPGVISR